MVIPLFRIEPHSVIIQDLEGRQLHREELGLDLLAEQEFNEKTLTRGWTILGASIVPVRTDSVRNFAADLFVPTVVNHAMRVQDVFFRTLATIPAFIWDMITLPFRLLTAPVRLIYTLAIRDANHPLVEYIPDGLENPALQRGYVKVVEKKETCVLRAVANDPDYSQEAFINGSLKDKVISLIDRNSDVDFPVHEMQYSKRFLYSPNRNVWDDMGFSMNSTTKV